MPASATDLYTLACRLDVCLNGLPDRPRALEDALNWLNDAAARLGRAKSSISSRECKKILELLEKVQYEQTDAETQEVIKSVVRRSCIRTCALPSRRAS